MFRDNVDYDVIAFVVMPNHVHLLIKPSGDKTLSDIIQSIKRFSSLQINRKLAREGRVWQKEYFDRIVRSSEQLKHYVSYIITNPNPLNAGEYTVYVSEKYRAGVWG